MKTILSLCLAFALLVAAALWAAPAEAGGCPANAAFVGAGCHGFHGSNGFGYGGYGGYGYNSQVVAVPFVQTFAVQQYVAVPQLVAAAPAPAVQYASPPPVVAVPPPVAVQAAPPVVVAAAPYYATQIVAATAPVQLVEAVSSYGAPATFFLGVNNFVEGVGFHQHFYRH